MSEGRLMSNEQLAMNKGKKAKGKEDSGLQLTSVSEGKARKSCLDCLHCKVSAKSTEKHTYCYCIKSKKRQNHNSTYWLTKKLCKDFDDDTAL
jgi:hypothetical protein